MSRNSNTVILPEDGSVEAAIKRTQVAVNDSWLVVGYKPDSKNELMVIGEGEGGLEEAKEHLLPKEARYVYLRKAHTIELARTVKFVYIDWTPTTLPPLRKALLSTHKGQISDLFKPCHVPFQWSDADEINNDVLEARIGFSAGTAVHVTNKQANVQEGESRLRDYKAAPKQRADVRSGDSNASLSDGVKASQVLKFEDEEALRGAIRAVRSDADPITWALMSYADINTLTVLETGEGDVDELASKLVENRAYYAIFRTTEQIDKTVAVRFGFLNFIPNSLKPTDKAKISTHRGFVSSLFSPVNAEFLVQSAEDFNSDVVVEKIGRYSGSKSNVVSGDVLEAEAQRKAGIVQAEAAKLGGPLVVPQKE